MTTATTPEYGLKELQLETTFGGMGKETVREIPLIDLTDFENRRSEITEQLWSAATEVGFFQLVNHGLDIKCKKNGEVALEDGREDGRARGPRRAPSCRRAEEAAEGASASLEASPE